MTSSPNPGTNPAPAPAPGTIPGAAASAAPVPTPAATSAPTPADAHAPAPGQIKPTITYDDFARLDLRVATVLAAEPHPKADRLLKLQIDLGSERRQICAGIREHYDPAALVGQQIVVIANLAPRTIRGEVSNGMLLAASAKDADIVRDVVILQPLRPVPPGSTVS